MPPIPLKRVDISEPTARWARSRVDPLVRRALLRGLEGVGDAVLWAYLQGVCDGAKVEANRHILEHLP